MSREESYRKINKLNDLKIGESMTYMIGGTGWSGHVENLDLVMWCDRAQDTGNYQFSQRLMFRDHHNYGHFEYICKRLK